MRYFTLRHLLAVVLLLTVFTSCKKNISGVELPVSANAGIPAFPLDWENIDDMPTPSGVVIHVPWASGSVKGFNSDLWYDYHQYDGWELVYNTFSTTSLPGNPFFVLYNKYRGLLRYYIYITTSGFATSSYLTTGLNLGPNAVNSGMLYYATQDLVDVSVKPASVSKIEPTQIATGTWYCAQYEIAYDPGTSGYTYQQLGLNLTLKWTNVTQVSLGGTLQGTIQGTITTPGTGFNLLSQAQKGALNTYGLAIFNSSVGPDPAKPENDNTLAIPAALFKSARESLTSGEVGIAKNILNGIINGSSGPTVSSLNATIAANITLTGSQSESGAIFPDPGLGLTIPGLSNSQQGIGYIPAYNAPMGVFSTPQKPTVYVHAVDGGPSRPQSTHTYTWSAIPIDINPAVTQLAQVVVEKQELIMLGNAIQTDGAVETTSADYRTNVGLTYAILRGYIAQIPVNTYVTGIRVIVKVTPNNGSAPFKIVKTFQANEVRI